MRNFAVLLILAGVGVGSGCQRTEPLPTPAMTVATTEATGLSTRALGNAPPPAVPTDFGFPVPKPEPALPKEMDAFVPPSAGPRDGPAVGEFTRSAGPDEVVTLAGPDFRPATVFRVYGQAVAGQGVTFERGPCVADDVAASLILPPSLPPWSMYLIWPLEGGKAGAPVAVNRTDAWWVGPDRAVGGDRFAVYGRNLAHSNGTTAAWVYLKPAGHAAGQWVAASEVNPYKVTCFLPAVAPGRYEVWTHNGHGGSFGWSGPLELNVLEADPFTGQAAHVFDVKKYGATGDGVADDTAAIQKALAAAGDAAPATLYFPAGTYVLNQPALPRDNVSWAGDGRDRTRIQPGLTFNADHSNAPMIFCMSAELVHGRIEFRDITFAWNPKNKMRHDYDHLLFNLNGQDTVKVTRCRFISSGHSGGTCFSASHMQVTDCEFVGDGIFLGGATQVRATGNHFRLTDFAYAAIGSRSGREIDVSRNTAQDDDPAAASLAGVGSGRLFVSQCLPDSNRHIYIGDNTTTNMAPPRNVGDANQGEQVLFEVGSSQVALTPTSCTATTATFATRVPSEAQGLEIHDRDAFIIAGRGTGQTRRVKAVSGNTITVSPAWAVVPDATSIIGIGPAQTRGVAYHNALDGKANYVDYRTASVGIQMYGNVSDVIFAGNAVTRMYNGVSSEFSQTPGPDTPTPSALFFNLIADNTLDGAHVGCNITTAWLQRNQSGLWGHLGNTYRRNRMANVLSNAVAIESEGAGLSGGDADQDVLEHNVVTGTHCGVTVAVVMNGRGPMVTRFLNTILYANTFDRGRAAFAGSSALRAGDSSTFWTADNKWLGFATGAANRNSAPPVSPP